MYGYYTPILLLQAFCIYHAYRNNAEQRWYWLIVFFPLVGCIIYLVQNFNNRTTLHTLTEGVKEVVNSNYKIEQLQKELRFSDNVKNRINLADAFVTVGRYQEAIELYESSLQGFMADDPPVRMKLLCTNFLYKNYAAAVQLGAALETEKLFKNAEERVAYAWSLYETGDAAGAEKVFADMDKSFTNYHQRMEFCKFLLKTEKTDLAKEKLTDLMEEFEHMKGPERRLKKNTYREIRDLYASQARA